jgi:hypothetical protein
MSWNIKLHLLFLDESEQAFTSALFIQQNNPQNTFAATRKAKLVRVGELSRYFLDREDILFKEDP